MAINIFSGSSSPTKKKAAVNAASNSVRAKQARDSLQGDAVVSNSGNTAVGTKGTLSKVGSVIGKVAGVASKFLPGIGGTISKGLANIFNDPEWWQSVPGEALTVNETLRMSKFGTKAVKFSGDNQQVDAYQSRAAILEVSSIEVPTASSQAPFSMPLNVTELETTQYLMPAIRRAVNAVPLQDAGDYAKALESAAALYAEWRNLRKYDYLLKHGQTYLASMNEPTFPLAQVANAAWLQGTINRLEEYLRANVRIPHTMCEYLAWRYGRIYKSNNSAKAALVMYNVLPLTAQPTDHDAFIAQCMRAISTSSTVQKANSDMYNTYFDHDYMVEVRDDTQFTFDMKEFMLRLNLQSVSEEAELMPTIIAIDSSLDNPTAFMASTVSSVGRQQGTEETLFPVNNIRVYFVAPPYQQSGSGEFYIPMVKYGNAETMGIKGNTEQTRCNWTYFDIRTNVVLNDVGPNDTVVGSNYFDSGIMSLMLAKSVDLYNIGLYIVLRPTEVIGNIPYYAVDITALSIDAGTPTLDVIGTEHVYAFANMVDLERKHSMSYKAAEKLVSKDVANLVDSVDIATVATK